MRVSVLIAVFFCAAFSFAEDAIEAYRARIRLLEMTKDVTGGAASLGLALETPMKGVIEFLDREDQLVEPGYPVEVVFVGVGLSLGGVITDDVELPLYRVNGKQVLDILGKYVALRAGQATAFLSLLTRWASFRTALNYQPRTGVVIPDFAFTQGAMLDRSIGQLWIKPRQPSDKEARDGIGLGSWNRRVRLR